MLAVIKTGGKQYKVEKGDTLKVERINCSSETIEFKNILLFEDEKGVTTIGQPEVKGVTVVAQILEQSREDKILVFKKKPRQNYRRKIGHRQLQTLIRIIDIKKCLA